MKLLYGTHADIAMFGFGNGYGDGYGEDSPEQAGFTPCEGPLIAGTEDN